MEKQTLHFYMLKFSLGLRCDMMLPSGGPIAMQFTYNGPVEEGRKEKKVR